MSGAPMAARAPWLRLLGTRAKSLLVKGSQSSAGNSETRKKLVRDQHLEGDTLRKGGGSLKGTILTKWPSCQCSSVVEYMLSMCGAVCVNPSPQREKIVVGQLKDLPKEVIF